MITNDHSRHTISHFIQCVVRGYSLCSEICLVPERVEMDFSWPLIHSVVIGMNIMDISAYLKTAMDKASGLSSSFEPTIVRLF